MIGKEIEFCLLNTQRFYGALGKSDPTQWVQLWFIPVPTETKLPKNTVCTTLLKTQSINNFGQQFIKATATGGVDSKVWTGSFEKQSNDLGTYYVVVFSTRDKTTEEEIKQHEQMIKFVATKPIFVDANLPPSMVAYNSDKELEDAKITFEVIKEGYQQKALQQAK